MSGLWVQLLCPLELCCVYPSPASVVIDLMLCWVLGLPHESSILYTEHISGSKREKTRRVMMIGCSMFVVCLVSSGKEEGAFCRFVEAPRNWLELLHVGKPEERLNGKS
jgi:hypothetical protein